MACAIVDAPVGLVEGSKEAPTMSFKKGGGEQQRRGGKRASPNRGRKANGNQNNGNGRSNQKNKSGGQKQRNGRQQNWRNSYSGPNRGDKSQAARVQDHIAEATAVAAAAVAAATSAVAKASAKEASMQLVSNSAPLPAFNDETGSAGESENMKSQQEVHAWLEQPKRELPKITPRSAQSALASFFWNHSALFKQLEHAKIVGWESNELDTVFSKGSPGKAGSMYTRSNSMPSPGQKRMNLVPMPKPSQRITTNSKLNKNTAEMRFIMQAVMKELDEAVGGCLTNAIIKGGTFFDVCAAPGGFSAYLLEQAPEAIGMGVTLSPAQGGHAMAIPNSNRYWCRFANVLDDPSEILFCKPSHKPPYVPQEFQNISTVESNASAPGSFDVDRFFGSAGETCPKPHLCDLVILDGHYLNGNNSKPNLDRSASLELSSDSLSPPACSLMNLVSKETEHATKSMWISQFIIAVQNLKQGGTLVFRSSTKPDLVQIAVLCLVARLFKGKIKPVKPTVCHMMRSSFYVVCQGFDLQMCAQLQVFPKMLFLWSQMKLKDPGSLPIWHPIDKLSEFSTPDNFINTWGPALINFFEPIWKFQALALNAMIQDCSTNSPRSPKSNGCKSKMCFYHKLGQCKRGNGQCWYAHETEELHPEIRKACCVRFMPLVSPWFPPNTSKII